MIRFSSVFLASAFSASLAFAAGSDDPIPPTPSPTSTECPRGQVWDEGRRICVGARSSALDDDLRYNAVRELAYAGKLDHASDVLDAMQAGDDRVLTYRGFIARQQGDWAQALAYYQDALRANPDNILARSYMGQGYVLQGEIPAAQVQLQEIRDRGGRGSWAEASLLRALRTGQTSAY